MSRRRIHVVDGLQVTAAKAAVMVRAGKAEYVRTDGRWVEYRIVKREGA